MGDLYVVIYLNEGLVENCWIRDDEIAAIAWAQALAIDANKEDNDIFVEQPSRSYRDSARIWTWDPEDNGLSI